MTVLHVNIKDIYKKEYILLWAILAFKAGLLNASGFLIAGSYVSHVTGFGTQVGLAMGHDEFTFGIELLVIPFAFIGGALIVSLVLDREYTSTQIPRYPLVQSMITFLLGVIVFLFVSGAFSTESPLIHDENSILLIGLLCLVCGLKNGLTTWATSGKIRTTHITGLATDIGLHLPKLFRPSEASSRYPEPKKVTYVRIITIISFSLGSGLAALLIPTIGYRVFYLALGISGILLWISIIHRRRHQMKILETMNLAYADVG